MEMNWKWFGIGVVIIIIIATITFFVMKNDRESTEAAYNDKEMWHNMTVAKATEYAQIEKLRQDSNNYFPQNPLEVFGGIALILLAFGIIIHGLTFVNVEKNTTTKNVYVNEKRPEVPQAPEVPKRW